MTNYISHFLIGGIPAVLVFACFGPYRMRALKAQCLRSGYLRETALHLFILCLFGLAALVLWPSCRWINGYLVILNARESLFDGVNLIPFHMILDYINALQTGRLFYGMVFLFGNIAMFMPLGFFPPLLFRGQRFKHIFCIGFGYSLTAETLQFFLGRHCDVDDVLLNVLGAVLGYLVYLLLQRLFPTFLRSFRCTRKK